MAHIFPHSDPFLSDHVMTPSRLGGQAQRIIVPGSTGNGADSEYVGLWHVDGHRENVVAVVLYLEWWSSLTPKEDEGNSWGQVGLHHRMLRASHFIPLIKMLSKSFKGFLK